MTPPGPVSELMQAYQAFFTELLTAFKGTMPGVTSASKVSPSRAFWFSFGAIGGVYIEWVFITSEMRFRAEIYIGTNNAVRNLQLFDGLASEKTVIEQAIGFSMQWERLESRKASRIAAVYPNPISIETSSQELAALKAWAIPTTVKLVEIFRPRLKGLSGWTSSELAAGVDP